VRAETSPAFEGLAARHRGHPGSDSIVFRGIFAAFHRASDRPGFSSRQPDFTEIVAKSKPPKTSANNRFNFAQSAFLIHNKHHGQIPKFTETDQKTAGKNCGPEESRQARKEKRALKGRASPRRFSLIDCRDDTTVQNSLEKTMLDGSGN
jgi:hypothetical protein